MIYAPIVIPTLNRVEHLRRCLNSLARNTYADKTELYISVDYPPLDKYREGWEEVNKLLETIDLSGFKKVYIFHQECNLGASENSKFLKKMVSEKYDRYIATEDDNEFSPNFLAYMNKGLELYKDNPKIIGICAAREANWINNGNITYSKLCPCYGFGTWIEKFNNLEREMTEYMLDSDNYTFKNIFPIFIHNGLFFEYYVKYFICRCPSIFIKDGGKNLYACDTVISIYMHCSDYMTIVPKTGKARTWGNDGSGEHMHKKDINVEKIELDRNNDFEYDDTLPVHFINGNYKIGDKYMRSLAMRCYRIIGLGYYLLFVLCGKNRYRVTRLIENLHKLRK